MSNFTHRPPTPAGNGRGRSDALWGDCPWDILSDGRGGGNSKYGYKDGDDYTSVPTLTGAYTATQAGGEGTFLVIDRRYGWAELDAVATTQHRGINVQRATGVGEHWAPLANTKMWFETRIEIHDIATATAINFFFGFHSIDTTILASGVLDEANQDWIGFKCETGLSTVLGTVANNTTESVTGTLLTLAAAYDADVTTDGSAILKLGLRVTGTGLVEFYLQGAKAAQLTTNIPTNLMVPSFTVQTDGTLDPLIQQDEWYAAVAETAAASVP